MALPAWALIVLVGISEIIIGGIIYVIMRKRVIDSPITGSYTVAPSEPA